ncbi:MAG: FAD-binding oxidoreductase [Pirellulales bacterium]|nr:FAD-binding oxidoreductase [Pirellulales bacterium]
MTHAGLPLMETIAPARQADVADALRQAYDEGVPVYPLGGGTHAGLGAMPTRPGRGLALGGLARVIDHAVADLTITVEAGLTIAALQKTLTQHGQRMPVDVPLSDRATVGGAVATGAAGPRRYRFGSIRDYVRGLAAVDGTGMPFASGGRVVKNAAGYDLCRLLGGSLGTLGVITQVTLMVRPLPETTAWLIAGVPDFDAAERLLAGLVHTAAAPAAIEWLLGPTWADDAALPRAAAGAAGRLVLGIEGTAAEAAWTIDTLHGELRQAGAVAPVSFTGAAGEALAARLVDFPAATVESPVVVQITVPPSAVVKTAREILGFDAGASLQIHAGDGIILAKLAAPASELAERIRRELRPLAGAAGGVLTVLAHPPEAALDAATVWGPASDGTTLMKTIHERFDPKGILNPGRFFPRSERRA